MHVWVIKCKMPRLYFLSQPFWFSETEIVQFLTCTAVLTIDAGIWYTALKCDHKVDVGLHKGEGFGKSGQNARILWTSFIFWKHFSSQLLFLLHDWLHGLPGLLPIFLSIGISVFICSFSCFTTIFRFWFCVLVELFIARYNSTCISCCIVDTDFDGSSLGPSILRLAFLKTRFHYVQDRLHGFPGLFTDTSELTRCYFLVFWFRAMCDRLSWLVSHTIRYEMLF